MIEFLSAKAGTIAAVIGAILTAVLGIYFKGRSDGGSRTKDKIDAAAKKQQIKLDGEYGKIKTEFDRIRTDIISEHPDERLR